MTDPAAFAIRLARARFRGWHRGTREADYIIGGYLDRYGSSFSEDQLDWFERLLDRDDVEIMAWAMGTQPVPDTFAGPMMEQMRALDYVDIPR